MTATDTLIRGIATGSKSAFAALYRGLQPDMLRYATGLLAGDRAAAEDAVDEAFTAIWTQAGRYTGVGSADGWVRRIVRNKAIDIARRNRERCVGDADQDWLDQEPSNQPSPFDAAANQSDRLWLGGAMAKLSPDHREALWLCYYEERPLAQIAQIMECPENTVKTRLFHARKHLHAMLAVVDA